MFSTDLYALLSEVIAGVTAVTLICMILWITAHGGNERFVDWLRRHIQSVLYGQSHGRGTAAPSIPKSADGLLYPIGISLVLGFGLAVQSAVDDAVDGHPIGLRAIAAPIQFVFRTKDAYRFSAFFSRAAQPANDWYWFSPPVDCDASDALGYKLTPLGREVFEGQKLLLMRFIPLDSLAAGNPPNRTKNTTSLDSWNRLLSRGENFLIWEAGETDEQKEDACTVARTVAKGIYYDGNNWAMLNETAANALRRWQIQIDTVGSVALLAAVAAFATIGQLVAVLVRSARVKPSGKSVWTTKHSSAARWLVGSLILAPLCAYSYVVGMKGYTNRAIGMYISNASHDDADSARVGCQVLDQYKEISHIALRDPPVCVVARQKEAPAKSAVIPTRP